MQRQSGVGGDHGVAEITIWLRNFVEQAAGIVDCRNIQESFDERGGVAVFRDDESMDLLELVEVERQIK